MGKESNEEWLNSEKPEHIHVRAITYCRECNTSERVELHKTSYHWKRLTSNCKCKK